MLSAAVQLAVGYIKRTRALPQDSALLPAFLLSSPRRPRKSAARIVQVMRCGTKIAKRDEDAWQRNVELRPRLCKIHMSHPAGLKTSSSTP
ncbi:hypothetical protein HYPSUDRAFT_889044 [Hypholoma sublateritium FD-334 SS-4]|uniref:Uncharacterized protein n=1 Tax=Hypholoma sublateritium (strain FD-334 SS-4) TaxID=945553 RepID=A0A0D2PHB9_HYPSF|nr:hypothetical protein HYPSUDRAFT_889044 [Hypholoma sublateritium FD-334 SS-4]